MKKRTNFSKLIQLWGIIFLVGIGGSIIVVNNIRSYHDFNLSVDQIRADYTARQKQIIRQEVERVVDMIHYEKTQSEVLTKRKIESRVNEAYAIAQHIYQQNSSDKSEAEIQKMIINAINPIRFEQGSAYYFISRLDGVAILFPSKPELEGVNLLDVQDTHGQYLTKDIIKIIEQSGEGFYQYHWTKPNAEGNDFKKISFVKQLGMYDWFIGAGLYVDDVEEQIKAHILSDISRIRFGKEGYIFINRLNGDALVSNGKLFTGTKKLWEVFDNDPEKMKNIFEKEYNAALKPEGDYIYYSHIKLTNPDKESPKTSYIYGIPEWQWLVGAGVYLDDVETDIALMQKKLNDEIRTKMLYFSLITIGIVVFFLVLFSRLNRRLKKDFNLFISFFNRAALSEESIDRTQLQFDELDWMAKNANKMLFDRNQAEEALKGSEAKFRGLIESSSDWIWEVNTEGIYTYVSPQVETILGYKPEEVIGKHPYDLMPTEEAERIMEIFRATIEKGESITTLENVNLHKDGRDIILETSGVPVIDSDGKIIGYRGIDRDITERKKAEDALQKMEKLKSVGTLAGGIAHDFNNILMGLFSNISLAKETLPTDHRGFKSLEEAENSMNRAIRLTKQLLTFSKGGAPVKENISLGKLVVDIISFDLSGGNVKLVFKQPNDLWTAQVDKGQIEQVFSNLTINARQAMPGGGHLYITLENADVSGNVLPDLDRGKYIRITVADDGPGIDRKHLDRLFDPYFTTKQAGSGLGLASIYSIISKHGGYICVDSQPGKGAIFTLYLPASDSRQPLEPKRLDAECETGKGTARILVMDDEEAIREVIVQMLESSGYYTETAEGGKQTIKMYTRALEAGNPFDVVIMDLTIPGGIGGEEAVREILEIDPDARVIVSSGYANDPVMANYAEYGFQGIASKPYTRSELIKVLNRVLEK